MSDSVLLMDSDIKEALVDREMFLDIEKAYGMFGTDALLLKLQICRVQS